jgi:hypothetical protein
MRPIDLVLSRLDGFKLRESGRDRWRSCCPAHGGSNPSALSIGIGSDDTVLLRCWSGCDVDQVVQALGLDLADLFPMKREFGHGVPPPKRRRLLSAAQCLEVVSFECLLVWVAARNLAAGHPLTDVDLHRLDVAAERIQSLAGEVRA